MIYGRIADFYTASKGPKNSVIKILVTGDGEEISSCTVCAEVPNSALQFDMIKAGDFIRFTRSNVFIRIEDADDIPFKKVGKTSSDDVTFYEHLRTIKDLQERANP